MTEFKKLIGKKVKIYLKNSFFYSGVIVNVTARTLELDDVKEGKIFLLIDSVRSIQEDNGRR